jgi:N-acetylmuramoyl-L-alanine amidase
LNKILRLTLLALLAVSLTLPATGQTPLAAQALAALPAAARPPRKVSVVVVDPAHGGSDTGARGSRGTFESDAVMDFGRAIRVALEAQGLHIVLTREGNQGPSLDDRSALVNGLSDAIFVTLHVSSTGTPGTARVYFCSLLPDHPGAANATTQLPASPPNRRAPALLNWDRAQEPFVDLSRRLALLVQIQLAQRFRGSPETPSSAPVRQLRTIAAPAIAIEISSIALDDSDLMAMGQPLGEALAHAVSVFQLSLSQDAVAPNPQPVPPR